MSDDDETYAYIMKKLQEISDNLTETEKQQAKIIAEYLKLFQSKKDHEGKQIFLIEDYKRRN
jgi:hypothetical protein